MILAPALPAADEAALAAARDRAGALADEVAVLECDVEDAFAALTDALAAASSAALRAGVPSHEVEVALARQIRRYAAIAAEVSPAAWEAAAS